MFQPFLALFAGEKQRQSRAVMGIRLAGARVILRMPDVADWQEWTRLRGLSAMFLQPWEPEWPRRATSRDYFMSYWRRLCRRWAQDREYAFLVCARESGVLLGGITLTDIRREAVQAATLGYWMGAPYAGQGYMKEAAALALDFAFRHMHVHRVEATCMPENDASLKLLRGLGFREIGLSKAYMKINGAWRDHLLFERAKEESKNQIHNAPCTLPQG